MGLIRAAVNATKGTIGDQWLDFFYKDAMPDTVLVSKGQRRADNKNVNKGNENIISNGSGIAVANGQCMIIVEQGRIMDVCFEPGLYTWNQSSEPSILAGDLESSVTNTLKTIARRFTFGGATAKDQRIYYFNMKELKNNKFGTATPIPFRVVDTNIGLDVDISLKCNGVFSFRIVDPVLFYTNVVGNIETDYTRDRIESQLRSEFLNALQPAFAEMSSMGLRYSDIPGYTLELSQIINKLLSEQWEDLRGLEVVSIAINSLSASQEDEDMIKALQRKAVMRDPGMAGATLVMAQADAIRAAAENENGAMMGFMGLGMAQQAGGINVEKMFAMGKQNPAKADWSCTCGVLNAGRFCADCGKPKPSSEWNCACGADNVGRFCSECGTPKLSSGWKCACGSDNIGRFCQDCGEPAVKE